MWRKSKSRRESWSLKGAKMTVEEQLLGEIAKKDQEAFREFYGRTVRPVHSYILSLTGNRQDAEDVM